VNRFDEHKAACFAYADEQWPGWEHRLDCGKLRMHNSVSCVAGQLSGGDTTAWASAYAATTARLVYPNMWASAAAVQVWRAEQNRRLAALVPPPAETYEEPWPVVAGQKNKDRLAEIAVLLRAAKFLNGAAATSIDINAADHCIDTALRIAEGK
jgi:hypothetical protein